MEAIRNMGDVIFDNPDLVPSPPRKNSTGISEALRPYDLNKDQKLTTEIKTVIDCT